MRVLKMAFAAACAVASTSAVASVSENQPTGAASEVSTCYYRYTVITEGGAYEVWECYPNGDGSY